MNDEKERVAFEKWYDPHFWHNHTGVEPYFYPTKEDAFIIWQACAQSKQVSGDVVEREDWIEMLMTEHDLAVPDTLLASPGGFGAYRDGVKAMLEKICPTAAHIEREYKACTATMPQPSVVPDDVVEEKK